MPETTDIRYGLYWKKPKEEEEVVLRCRKEWPILKEVRTKRLESKDTGPDQTSIFDYDPDKKVESPTHILIEGDNYHALAALSFTHRGKVDVIIIDPPYNTGNKDFMYNDHWVDKDDAERHSKWLSFMYRRLNLAKDLLKETGVVFINIDDNALAQLKLMCDEVFGENNFIKILVWNKKRTHGNKAKGFVDWHEYILAYGKHIGDDLSFEIPKSSKQKLAFNLKDANGNYRLLRLEMGKFIGQDRPKCRYGIKAPDGSLVYPQKNWWRWGEEKYKTEKDRVVIKKRKETWVPYFKDYLCEDGKEKTTSPVSIIEKIYNSSGANELKEILGEGVFSNPKPKELIKLLLRCVNNTSALVLDFFAGSGTTGHAVLELNKEDGGSRQFILVTNNENNICTEVCYPRIAKVMKGYTTPKGKKIEGLGGSLKYYKVGFEKASDNGDQAVFNIARSCRDILREKENIRNRAVGDMEGGRHYEVFEQDGKYMAIYYSLLERGSWNELREILNAFKGKRILYYFSLSKDGAPVEDFEGWDEKIEKRPIPHDLIGRYKTVFRENNGKGNGKK